MPVTIVLDSIETCLSLEPLRPELVDLGLAPGDLELWFSRALRDAFAFEVIGEFRPFTSVLEATLVALLRVSGRDDARASHVVAKFAELPAHPDVRPALELALEYGARVCVLTNGSTKVTRDAYAAAQLADLVGTFISVDDVGHFKPAREVYLHAARVVGERPGDCVLVAAHSWDVRGALAAGLRAAFVERGEPVSDDLVQRGIPCAPRLDLLLGAVLSYSRREPDVLGASPSH